MGHARHLLVLCLACACEPSEVVGYGEIDPSVPSPAVYDTIELVFDAGRSSKDPFREFLEFRFWNDLESYEVDGFFDGYSRNGNRLYKVRFMVTEPGTWHYEWSIGDNRGQKDLVVQERRDFANHGHVRVHASPDGALWHDDGSVHYWVGGKSFTANNYGVFSKGWEDNTIPPEASPYDTRYSDDQVGGYLDLMETHGHNGTRLKIALFPLQGDGFGWDLDWIHRAEDWIRMMQARHIYCQITFFDARSRRNDRWFEGSDNPRKHVFNAWEGDENAGGTEEEEEETEDTAKKRNYIRTIVARFAGFWNVYWELVNDVERPGSETAKQFVAQSKQYLDWLEKYDRYDLAVGATESPNAGAMDVDIEFPRTQARLAQGDSPALVWNEMVGDCTAPGVVSKPSNDDATMRNPAYRFCYRSAVWRAFVSGAFGASTASWLGLSPASPNVVAVDHVMGDAKRLQTIVITNLLDLLGIGVNELEPDPNFVVPGEDDDSQPDALNPVGTRAKAGQVYVSYFSVSRGKGEGMVSVRLPPGNYTYRWMNPRYIAGGELEDHDNEQPATDGAATPITGDSNPVTIPRPAFDDDLVLVVHPPSTDIP